MKVIRPIEITDSNLDSTNVSEDEYSLWVIGTTYAEGDIVIMTTGVHRLYESLQDSNTGNNPSSTSGFWLDIGATNAWSMFDESVGNATSNSDTIEVEITPGRINSLALLEISANNITIVLNDPSAGDVYDETIDMVSDSGITDWYAYYFEPIVHKTDLVITDLPMFGDASLTVTIDYTGSTAECGKMVVGIYKDLGETQYGLQSGIMDYSRKETDDYGNTSVTLRRYAKTAQVDLFIMNSNIDATQQVLTELRSTPAVWVGSNDYSLSIIYGFYLDFNIVIEGPNHSECNLEIEGLV